MGTARARREADHPLGDVICTQCTRRRKGKIESPPKRAARGSGPNLTEYLRRAPNEAAHNMRLGTCRALPDRQRQRIDTSYCATALQMNWMECW